MAEPKTRSTRRSAGDGGEAGGRAGTSTPRGSKRASEHVCPVAFCPIGMALTTVSRSDPEMVDHLMGAARELFLAFRTLLDVRADDLGGREHDGSELERIEIA